MYRYFALIWNPSDARACAAAKLLAGRLQATATGWTCVLEQDGLQAFDAGRQPGSNEAYRLVGGAGVVFGKLFPVRGPVSARCVRDLLDRYWGRYAAILRDRSTGNVQVLRDPGGNLPCLLTTYQGVSIVFSDVEDCLSLGVMRFSINWKYVAAHVPHSALQVHETGLNEVSDVLPGGCLTFGKEGVERSLAWKPMDVAERNPIEDAGDAAEALRATVRACVHAWASAYEGIVHCLSGGLDSSIVLSCLKDAPSRPSLLCLNYFGTGSHEDERRYARLAARHTNAELLECQLDSGSVRLEKMLTIRRSAKPWSYLYELQHGELESRLAAERGATAIFSGGGGDALFFQMSAELAVADYLWRKGLRPGLLRVLSDAAVVSRMSFWALLRKGLRARFRRTRWNPFALDSMLRTLVNPDLVKAAMTGEHAVHPWLLAAGEGPPGKLWHIATMSVPPAFYDSFGLSAPDRVFPLVSQPLIELCLRIPTYVLISGGWDRAIARRAFARDLPGEIVRRTRKGNIDQHSRKVLDANIDFVRELLLDGLLVRERFLDRQRLEHYLSDERTLRDLEYNDILHKYLCTEVWLRRWHETEQRVAA